MDSPDDQTDAPWRCKACGRRQTDPEPPCEHCWNTTLVRGEGAASAAGVNSSRWERLVTGPGPTAGLLVRVQWATSRAAVLSLAATLGLLGAYDAATRPSILADAAYTGVIAAALLTATFSFIAIGTTLWRTVDAFVDV